MLIVEDDILFQKVLERNFKNKFEIYICDSAEEYYENCSAINYDIIIMDISLRGKKSGLDLTKEIKANSTYNGAPMLCLSAHAQTKMRQTATESGSDLFITKPVSNRILKETVEFLLKSA